MLVEVGSRDGLDSIKIAKNVNSKQNIIFEADPNLIKDIEKFLAWAKHDLPKNVAIAFEQIKERLDKIKQEFDKLTPDEKQEFLNYGKSDPKISQFTKSFL